MSHRQRDGAGRAERRRGGSARAELVGDPGRARAWTLMVEGVPQSHVDLDDPRRLEFEYMRRLGHLVDLAASPHTPLRVLHLGGGGLTLARYVEATRPGSRQLAVESDAALADLVRQRLPLGRLTRPGGGARPLRIRIGDARAVLEQLPAGSFDVVVTDVFAGGRTPAHLTSAEFARAVARALAPSGLCAANVGDGPPLAHTRAQVATLRSVFARACVLADAAVLRGRRFGNLVVAAGRRGLPIAELTRRAAGDPFPGRVVHGGDVERFAAGARPVTDAEAAPSPPPPPDVVAGWRTLGPPGRRGAGG